MNFRLEVLEVTSGCLTLRPHGEIDVTSADALVEVVVTRAEPLTECAIDLSRVTFMDSSGIKALVVCREALHRRGATMRVVEVSDTAARVLHLTGLDQVLQSDEATAAAVAN